MQKYITQKKALSIQNAASDSWKYLLSTQDSMTPENTWYLQMTYDSRKYLLSTEDSTRFLSVPAIYWI